MSSKRFPFRGLFSVAVVQRSNAGFSLVELMVVLTIVAIAFNIAMPSFTAMIARNQAATDVNDFLLTVNLARSEALKIGGTTSIQALDASDTSNEFGAGWCVVEGDPGDCSGTLIRSFPALVGNVSLNSIENASSIQFNYLGELADGVVQKIDLCTSQTDRRIFIALIGRPKSHRPNDADAAKQPACS